MEMILQLLVMTHHPGTRGHGGGEAPGEKQSANYFMLKACNEQMSEFGPKSLFSAMPPGALASAPASHRVELQRPGSPPTATSYLRGEKRIPRKATGSLVGLCLTGAGQPQGARLTSRPAASLGPLSSRSPSLPQAPLRPPSLSPPLGFQGRETFWVPWAGDSLCHRSGDAHRCLLGDSKQSEIGAFPLGWAKWVRNQPRYHVQGCFSSVSFLKPVSLWLAGQDQALLHLTFVAVHLGNCNLQDRFLPNDPRKNPWGIRNTPTQKPKACGAPLCKPLHGSEGSAAPVLPRARGTRELGALARGQGQGQEAPRGRSCAGFSLHCCCSTDMFNCSSTAEIICRYECRPRGR